MNSKIAESKPKTRNAPESESKNAGIAGSVGCPELKGLYQGESQNSILKICISDIEKLNDVWVYDAGSEFSRGRLANSAALIKRGSEDY